jgi:hypothetical protein
MRILSWTLWRQYCVRDATDRFPFAGVVSTDRIDCGYSGIDQTGCESKGCCWSPLEEGSSEPWCFYDYSLGGYTLTSYTESSTSLTGTLQVESETTIYGSDIAKLSLQVVYEDTDYVHVKITDSTATRWEVPEDVLSRPAAVPHAPISSLQYDFSFEQEPFTFTVTRKTDSAVLFQSLSTLVFKDQYIQVREHCSFFDFLTPTCATTLALCTVGNGDRLVRLHIRAWREYP